MEADRYRDTTHAAERQEKRAITVMDVSYVIRHGFHEKAKDVYREEYKAWSYAIRGKTVDGRRLRLVIAFDEVMMLLITAIDLDA